MTRNQNSKLYLKGIDSNGMSLIQDSILRRRQAEVIAKAMKVNGEIKSYRIKYSQKYEGYSIWGW